jgi:hypothetical protein
VLCQAGYCVLKMVVFTTLQNDAAPRNARAGKGAGQTFASASRGDGFRPNAKQWAKRFRRNKVNKLQGSYAPAAFFWSFSVSRGAHQSARRNRFAGTYIREAFWKMKTLLYCEDCVPGIPLRVETGSVDIIVTSPPYNLGG